MTARAPAPPVVPPLIAVLAAGLLTACTTGADPGPVVQATPPAPPAACLLDTAALNTATGLTWTPDQTTGSDTRCVYDPGTGPTGGSPTGIPSSGIPASGIPASGIDFVAVDLAPVTAADVATELDTIATLCDDGSRVPMTAADDGFVCRFQAGSVFGAAVRGGQLVTVAASAVPPGTTAAQLVVAFTEQLARIRSR